MHPKQVRISKKSIGFFRDSKLTRILQNSLGGNSRTAIVCTISPFDYETSLSTLRFGSDAKRIRNKPVINQVLSEDASLLQKRNKEIESLKALICVSIEWLQLNTLLTLRST